MRSGRPPGRREWPAGDGSGSARVRTAPRRAARYRLKDGEAARVDGMTGEGSPFRPQLSDPEAAVREVLAASEGDPRRAVERLEALRAEFAPDAHLLSTLCRLLKRCGQTARTVEVGREAIEACFRQRQGLLAAQLLSEIDADAHALGVDRDRLVALGATLVRTGEWPVAFRALASSLMASPSDEAVARTLLALVDRLLERREAAEEAWRIAEFVAVVADCPQLQAEIASRVRRAEAVTPTRRPAPPLP